MSTPLSRREILALGSVAGGSFVAGCQDLTDRFSSDATGPQRSEQAEVNESLGIAYSKHGSSFPSEGTVHSGWVHIVSDGESADLTFDVRFCGELGIIEPALRHSIANEYILKFDASSDLGEKSVTSGSTVEPGCDSVTRVVGGANVPNEWESLVVTVDNTEIRAIEKSGTMPELRPLPDPVQFD